MGAAALGMSPFLSDTRGLESTLKTSWSLQWPDSLSDIDVSLLYLYAGNVAWAICYEIVYSFQDVRDDAKAGVRTITLLIRGRAKPLLSCLAALQVAMLLMAGVKAGYGTFYFLGTVCLTALSMIVRIPYTSGMSYVC